VGEMDKDFKALSFKTGNFRGTFNKYGDKGWYVSGQSNV